MSDAAVTLEVAPPPEVDAMAKMSTPQLAAFWAKQTTNEWNAKLFSGDPSALKILRAYEERKDQLATGESLIDAARDPNQPQPVAGGPNKNGMSKADEVLGVQWQLEAGASLEELAEREAGAAFVGPERYWEVERDVRALLRSPEFTKHYLAGHPVARKMMDEWHWTKVTSQPWPAMPRFGIAK
jgi:hypothetical protein